MNDLVERLRKRRRPEEFISLGQGLIREAADEIERLTQSRDQFCSALLEANKELESVREDAEQARNMLIRVSWSIEPNTTLFSDIVELCNKMKGGGDGNIS